jgi:hypothetical protein
MDVFLVAPRRRNCTEIAIAVDENLDRAAREGAQIYAIGVANADVVRLFCHTYTAPGREQIQRQARSVRPSQEHAVAAVLIQLDLLRFRPERAAAFLRFVKGKAEADYAGLRALGAFLRSVLNHRGIDRAAIPDQTGYHTAVAD